MEITYVTKAMEDGHLRLEKSGKAERVVYAAVERSERWSDSEEQVRAEFYAELIYRYGYSPTGSASKLPYLAGRRVIMLIW